VLAFIAANKVAQALKLSEEDNSTIDELKRQVEKAWTMVEAANSREEQANSTLDRLQTELHLANHQLQRHAELVGSDTTVEEIVALRDSLQAQVRML
jgi:outer membrane murein-binding lipoprotein Lpp